MDQISACNVKVAARGNEPRENHHPTLKPLSSTERFIVNSMDSLLPPLTVANKLQVVNNDYMN